MFVCICLVLGLLSGSALSGVVLNEELPPEQMRQFVDDVIFQAKSLMLSRRDLGNVDLVLNDIYLGAPIELSFVAHNISLEGPNDLVLYGNIEGEEYTGLANIRAILGVGNLEVRFPYFAFDFFGFIKGDGCAQMSIQDAKVDVNILIYRNVLTRCQVTASVSKPTGAFMFTFGKQGSWLKFIMSFLESIMSQTVLPNWLVQWAFFPDVSDHLQGAIQEAAKIVACK